MSDQNKTNHAVLVWGGISLGILAGVATGLWVARRQLARRTDPLVETVEELRDRAERVLGELSANVAELAQIARDRQDDGTPPLPGSPETT